MIRGTRAQATVVVAATAAALFALQGRALSQGQAEPMLPLEQVAYIKASNAEPYDHFACGGVNPGHTGNSIALSGDGTTMAIGAPFESSAATGINGDQNDNSSYASGAVYVYVRQGDSWSQSGYVKASNAGQSDHFGASVSLSRDGSTMAISAHWESSAANGIDGDQADDSIPHAGAVYIFTRTGNTWTQQAYVKASNTGSAPPGDGDQFGYSIALSGDGNRLAVGAIDEDSSAQGIDGNQQDNSQLTSGAVYVFARNGATWAQEAYVKGSHVEVRDLFGFSVALNFSGDTLVAGAFDEGGASRTINGPHNNDAGGSGALFVFARQDGAWSEQAYIKGSRNEDSDQMGYAVAISDDGDTIAVGVGDEACLTPGINPPGCADDRPALGGANIWVGAAYVFVRTGTAWTEQAFIKANNPRPYNSFGSKLALSGDGDTLAVGAYLEDNAAQGVHAPEIQPFLTTEYLNPWREGRDQADESGALALLLLLVIASCANRSDEGERLLELIETIQQEAAVTLPDETNADRYQRIGDYLETMEPELSTLIQDPSTWQGDCVQLSADVRSAWDRMIIFAMGGQNLDTFRRDGGSAAAGIDRRSALLNEVLGCDAPQ